MLVEHSQYTDFTSIYSVDSFLELIKAQNLGSIDSTLWPH